MKNLAFTIFLFSIISCGNKNKINQPEYLEKETEQMRIAELPKPVYNCNVLTNKIKLFAIADSLLKIKYHPNIINLQTIDSSDVIIFEDNFIFPDKKSTMVFFSAEAGFSSGNSTYLLILFHCKNGKAEIIWSGQENLFNKKNIKDLNADGVQEVVNISGAAWMSSENELFEIINFKNATRNVLYSTLSNTQRDYFEEDWYQLGDTISCVYQNKIIDAEDSRIIKIQQIKTVKLFNGGTTQKEAFKKSKIEQTTALIFIE